MTATSIFTEFGSDLLDSHARKNPPSPFKNHPQIPFIIDSLSRYERHHLALISDLSDKVQQEFMKAVAQQISDENVPNTLRDCHFIYFDAIRFQAAQPSKEKIARDFQALFTQLKSKNQRIIFVINQPDFLLNNDHDLFIKQILMENDWRVIIFISQKNGLKKLSLEHLFSVAQLKEPDSDSLIALLKMYRTPLENFHRVIISDDVIHAAFTMAAHYLPGDSCFDKTLELLDSAAARASMLDRHAHNDQKTTVTPHFLTQIISNRTHIPITHLQGNTFQVAKCVDNLKKNIFGQDAAISMMASLLQNACIKLQDNNGPLCSFLLVGPQDAGKTEMAYAMAEHLFGNRNTLLRVNLIDTPFFPKPDQTADTHWLVHIQQTPYAIVLIEDIDKIPDETLVLMNAIFHQGYLVDEQNNKYDFRHAIIIATTRMGSDQMNDTIQPQPSPADNKTLDLMQLVLNEHVLDSFQQHSTHLSPQELYDEMIPVLAKHFPEKFLQKFNIIPFVSPDYAALEKIVRSKIKMLARRLHNSFGMELSFAPEVVKFLAHEALWRKSSVKSLDKLLEQYLYSSVTHAILLHADDKDRSKRLLIQLNESGHLLRCEFITTHEAAFYNL